MGGTAPTLVSLTGITTVTSGQSDYTLLLGDWKNYVIADRVGTTLQFIPAMFGANHLPTYTAGWAMHFRVGTDVVSSTGFKLLKL